MTQAGSARAAPDSSASGQPSFAALRQPDFRPYLMGGFATMMGDNVEHVISYWIIFQLFHSPWLAGFAIISHWLPFLLFSVWAGALADRYDCRRLVQLSQVLFLIASAAWGLLIFTESLEIWHACVLLSIHGMAGVFGGPAGQLMIHDIVGRENLASAVRLNATARQLGQLCGPAIGGGLMLVVGPGAGLLVNAATYIPFTLWLFLVPFTGHSHAGAAESRRGLGLGDMVQVFRDISGNRTIVAMVAIVGLVAAIVGPAIQVQLPEFAAGLGAEDAGIKYTVLQTAYALGAVFGGISLEWSGVLRPGNQMAIALAGFWCLSVLVFAAAPVYAVAVGALLFAGFFRLAFGSMAQALVQLASPPDIRGRVMGLFTASQFGLQAGSGVTVGILGSLLGAHWSLGISSAVLLVAIALLYAYVRDVEQQPLAPARP